MDEFSEEQLNTVICTCGKKYQDFEDCPICGEKLCIECEDYIEHHRVEALKKLAEFGEEYNV